MYQAVRVGYRALQSGSPRLRTALRLREKYASRTRVEQCRRFASVITQEETDERKWEEITNAGSGELEDFDMTEKLRSNLRSVGVEVLFPVQINTFEKVKGGQDVIVRSRTGSGKTLAFGIPIIDSIYRQEARRQGPPTAVILTPTRELALQIQKEFHRIAPDVRCTSIYGGSSITNQIRELKKGTEVVVGTPGRVMDLLSRGELKFNQVKCAVLDEADEMLKMGFEEEITKIFGAMPPKEVRQTVLFSATMGKREREIAQQYMKRTEMIDLVGEDASKIPDRIELIAMPCSPDSRIPAMAAVLEKYCKPKTRALIFAQTKAAAVEISISPQIQNSGFRCMALHGDMQQASREVALQAFRDGTIDCLVATDVAARGLDIPQVELVIHQEIPMSFESFIHRTGRTGRAGRSGLNILLHSDSDVSVRGKFSQRGRSNPGKLEELEKFCGRSFARRAVPGAASLQRERLDLLLGRLSAVPEDKMSRFQKLAVSLLGSEAMQGLDVAGHTTKDTVLKSLSSSLACLAQSKEPTDYSALVGAPNRVTLVYDGLPGTFQVRSPPNGTRMQPTVFRALHFAMDHEVEFLLAQTKEALPVGADVFPHIRGHAFCHFVTISSDLSRVFFDVHPAIADLILRTNEKATEMLPISMVGDEDLPVMMSEDRSSFEQDNQDNRYGGASRGGYSRGGYSRGGSDRGGFNKNYNKNNNNYNNNDRYRENGRQGGRRGGNSSSFSNRRDWD